MVIADEPTNHLDMRSAQIMERALAKFRGAVPTVSHDRFFVDKVAKKLLMFDADGSVTSTPRRLDGESGVNKGEPHRRARFWFQFRTDSGRLFRLR
ncbi:MAG: ATPase subunit of ABC transporter with duplicated ATPase domains [Myxococcota bacterium]